LAVGEDSRIVALHARLDERRARLIIDALLRSVLAKDKVEGERAVLAHHQLPLCRVHLQAQALLLELLLGDHGTHAHGDLDVVVGAFILGWHGRRTKATGKRTLTSASPSRAAFAPFDDFPRRDGTRSRFAFLEKMSVTLVCSLKRWRKTP
jgi:hypothetical protein